MMINPHPPASRYRVVIEGEINAAGFQTAKRYFDELCAIQFGDDEAAQPLESFRFCDRLHIGAEHWNANQQITMLFAEGVGLRRREDGGGSSLTGLASQSHGGEVFGCCGVAGTQFEMMPGNRFQESNRIAVPGFAWNPGY